MLGSVFQNVVRIFSGAKSRSSLLSGKIYWNRSKMAFILNTLRFKITLRTVLIVFENQSKAGNKLQNDFVIIIHVYLRNCNNGQSYSLCREWCIRNQMTRKVWFTPFYVVLSLKRVMIFMRYTFFKGAVFINTSRLMFYTTSIYENF